MMEGKEEESPDQPEQVAEQEVEILTVPVDENLFLQLAVSSGYSNAEETEEDNKDQEGGLEKTQKQFHERNEDSDGDVNIVRNEEDSDERQQETESENEGVNSDEQNLQPPETNPPVTRSKSKKKMKNSCDKCLRNFHSPSGLKQHKLYHCKGDNTKQHKCPHCDKSFVWLSQLQKHAESHTGVRPFHCSTCGKSFRHPNTVKNHVRLHSKKPYKCELCNKVFWRRDSFAHHECHTDEKPYQCDHCDLKCRLKSTLRRHWQRIHSGNKPYKCKECPKEFAIQTDLIKHIRTHTEQTQYIYSCKQCNRAFTAKNSLRVHMLIHTGEKPFSCDMCGMSFRYKRTLKNHYAIHTDEKPTTCPTCNKGFSSTSNLKRHQLIHSGEKPFSCPYCGRRYNQRSNVTLHLKKNWCRKAPNRQQKKKITRKRKNKKDENKKGMEQCDVELVTEAIVECGDDVTASLSLNSFIVEECISGAL
ncbi:uncharacterized protein LOC144631579 [Oculina patagonica]